MQRTIPTREAFLADIIANPDNDVPRLVYADWLDDHGEEDRGQLIRLQIRLEELEKVPGRPQRGPELAGWLMALHREASIIASLNNEVCRCERCLRDECTRLLHNGRVAGWVPLPLTSENVWSRGFLEHVTITCSEWLDCGPGLAREHPVRTVHLRDKEPYKLEESDPVLRQWRRQWRNPSAEVWSWWHGREDMGKASIPDCLWPWFLGQNVPPHGLEFCVLSSSKDDLYEALSRACIAWARSVKP